MAGAEENKVEICSPEGKSPAAPLLEVVSVELAAPAGWKKKFTPKKGGTPKRNEIVFISPTGEEIRSKRHLDQYLRSHPDGPTAAEFDWGTGDTPRRSARISEKAKATGTPEGEPPKKRERKSSSKEATEQKGGEDAEDGASEAADTVAPETKDAADTEMKEAEDGTNKAKEEGTASEAVANDDAAVQDSEDKLKEEEAKTEDKKVDEPKKEVKIKDKEAESSEQERKIEEKKVDEPWEEETKTEENVLVFKEEEVETEGKNVFAEVSIVDHFASLPKAGKENDKVGKENQVISEVPQLTSECKEEVSADKEIEDEHLKLVSGGHKDEWGASITKDVHSRNFEDPQQPHKASSVSC